MKIISPEEVADILKYDSESGIFTWIKPRPKVRVGNIAGSLSADGYVRVTIYHRRYMAHRLAWLFTYGQWPPHEIDHIDGNRSNNKACNLRLSTSAENNQNISLGKNNKSGYLGVGWLASSNAWRAQIQVSGKNKYLGLFSTAELAHAAYLEEKKKIHPFQPIPRVKCMNVLEKRNG